MWNLLFAGALAEETAAAAEAAETATAAVETAAAAVETAAAAAEAAGSAASAPTWTQTAFEQFSQTPATVWIAVGVLIALGLILLAAIRTQGKWSARMLSYGAICISLSFVLSCIRLFRMSQGGSVTPGSMRPLMLFSAAYGVGPGLLAGLVYGVLQYFQGGWFANVWQFALDYLLALAALGPQEPFSTNATRRFW